MARRPMTAAEIAALKELLIRAADELSTIKDSAPRMARAYEIFGRGAPLILRVLKEWRAAHPE